MKLKDIIKVTCYFLGIQDVITCIENDIYEGIYEETYNKMNSLTNLSNLVLNELSASYIPMCKTEEIPLGSKKIDFINLSENIVKVMEVLDADGNSLNYEQHLDYITVPKTARFITYSYMPANYGITEEVGYSESQIPTRVIAYGLAAEYCLSLRRFDEAVMWHKRYIDAIKGMCTPKHSIIKKRSWC